MTATARLTDHDRRLITRARELAGLPDMEAIRVQTGKDDSTSALAHALGQAQVLLDLLASLAEGLGGCCDG